VKDNQVQKIYVTLVTQVSMHTVFPACQPWAGKFEALNIYRAENEWWETSWLRFKTLLQDHCNYKKLGGISL